MLITTNPSLQTVFSPRRAFCHVLAELVVANFGTPLVWCHRQQHDRESINEGYELRVHNTYVLHM